MVSQHSGYSELAYVETEKVCVTIKGSATHPKFEDTEIPDEVSHFVVSCSEDFSVKLHSLEVQKAQTSGRTWDVDIPVRPLFYEQQSYEILIEPYNTTEEITFWHDNANIRDKVAPVGRTGKILLGMINFESNIGYSDFVIRIAGKDYLTLKLEVFPSKISYKEDYQALIADVTNEVYGLIFDFMKKTYQSFRQNSSMSNSQAEFFAVIHAIFNDMLKSTDLILSQPHHILAKTYENMPANKVKRVDAKTRNWIQKHPNKICINDGRITALDKPLAVKKFITYDTRENRFTKFILQSTAKKLQHFKNIYCKDKDADNEIVKQIDKMQRELMRRANNSFLSEVGAYTPSAVSLVFSMASGYRELYKYYLMLVRGLTLSGDLFNLSVKDVALLYEYWCFIKLNSILKKKYKLVSKDIIQTKRDGLSVALVKGKDSKVKYQDPITGDEIILSYNPREMYLTQNDNTSPTTAQRPDNVLSLIKKERDKDGVQHNYSYVFDAKYRIDPALEGTYYQKSFNTPGPVEETINTMHRYRDAIVSHDNLERTKFGAYVLFPYNNEEEYKSHHFYKSIEKVNIGGLPFLPSATKLVEEMLDSLINESPESAFERAILPVGIEEKLAKVDWEHRDVLIGTLKNREQLKICLDNNFYYTPKRNVAENRLPMHYIAIYQSKEKFGKDAGILYYGEVKFTRPVKRREITEMPKNSDEEYYRFDVKEWKQLPKKIVIQGRGLRSIAYTTFFLLNNCENSSELTIKSGELYRLLLEIKRLTVSKITAEENTLTYGNSTVKIADGKIYLNGEEKMSASEFSKNSGVMFRKLAKELS